MESPTLTLAALEAQIQALPASPADNAIFARHTRWWLGAAVSGGLVALMSVKLLPKDAFYTLVVTCIGLIVEITGVVAVGISLIPKSGRRLPTNAATLPNSWISIGCMIWRSSSGCGLFRSISAKC